MRLASESGSLVIHSAMQAGHMLEGFTATDNVVHKVHIITLSWPPLVTSAELRFLHPRQLSETAR